MSKLLFAIDHLIVVVMFTIGLDFFWFIDYCKKERIIQTGNIDFFFILTVINDCLVDHVCGKFYAEGQAKRCSMAVNIYCVRILQLKTELPQNINSSCESVHCRVVDFNWIALWCDDQSSDGDVNHVHRER